MMRRLERVAGTLIEPLGDIWVAFSPLSGETALVNDASVAILEILGNAPMSEDDVYDALAADTGLGRPEVAATIAPSWEKLIESGLVRECPVANLS